jgi:hypothetical protein
MKLTDASKPGNFKSRSKPGFRFKMKQTFGDGGMAMIQEAIKKAPRKERKAAASKLIDTVKAALTAKQMAAQQAQAAPPQAPPQAPQLPPGPPAPSGMKKGGKVEYKAMVQKEIDFFKKKGAPASMIKHEIAEKNAIVKKAIGGSVRGVGCAVKGGGRGKLV